ncbi:MAG: DUF933 domain-containing protein [Patescibacteria group bacterium]|nr:DUF933 domain-containing protein [Patescibacteria group bacterium]
MKTIGFCGLPNSGKSTLLKLLTKTETLIANYPFTTISPKLARGFFISNNLLQLHSLTKTPEIRPAYLNFLDVPGLIRGSHKGLGLGNEFLSYLRQSDIILEIIRNFKREDVIHSEGEVDPERDILLIEEEILQSEKKIIEENLQKIKRQPAKKDLAEKFIFILDNLQPFKRFPELKKDLKEYNLLLTKDWFLIFNGDLKIDKKNFENLCFKSIYQLDFQFELELQENRELQKEYPSQVNDLLNQIKKDIDLIEFFTFTDEITQSWLIERDNYLIKSAELIHSDFAKKFKSAEVINIKQFLIHKKNWSELKNLGLLKQVGRDYCIEEGDIIRIII